MHKEDVVSVNEKLTGQPKKLSARVTELEGEVMVNKKTVADLKAKVKVKAAKKRA